MVPGAEGAGRPPDAVPEVERLEGEPAYASFRKRRIVGRGGNATVHEAVLEDTGRVVALKEPHVPGNVDDATAERFRKEAEVWERVDDHDHVVTVLAWDADPHPWIALEFVDGGSLAEPPDGSSVERGAWTGACVAGALDHAHRSGVVHLDLRPENVLLATSPAGVWPVPKVADWGLAAFLRADAANLEGLSPRYAAPEQFAPERYGSPGPATDVYQLGVVLYEHLVGTVPFEGPPRVLREAVLEDPPPPPSGRNPDLPAAVDRVLDRALAKAPADRYDSAAALGRALERLAGVGDDAGGTPGSGLDRDREATEPPSESSGGSAAGTTTAGAGPYDRALTLAEEGFVRLSERYFARRDPAAPLDAWRRGVRLVDARAGRAVERTVPDGGAGRSARASLTDRVLDGLRSGSDTVVLGPPGSGKSTVCRQVACEWFDRGRGPVFYRESGQGARFERPDALAGEVTDTDGHALVVVEDAVRPEAKAVFEFLELVEGSGSVTVLLDARESEWQDAGRRSDADPFGTDPVASGREAVEPVYVPRPDAREHERFVRAVEEATDRPVDVDVEQLRGDVRRAAAGETEGARPGELFYLLHRLSALVRDPLADGDAPTSLTEVVWDVHGRLADRGDRVLDVGTCVNVLNASGIGVAPELLYAVAPDDPLAVDEALEVLEGRVVFPEETDWSGGTTAYPAIHGAWSVEFLVHSLEAEGEGPARERFGRVLTRVLSLADDAAVRERVAGALQGDAPYLARIERDPGTWVEETLRTVYALGRERPKLAPLFGDGEHDSVRLPAACSESVAAERPVWLGRMFLAAGDYDRAGRAFERLPRKETDRRIERLLGLARVATERGEFDEAVEHAEECLALVEDEGDEAPSLARARAEERLGAALSGRGDFEDADSRFRAALDRFEALGDRRRMARTLKGMGIAAAHRSEYDRAREHLERSLDISRELGDRRAVANKINNLGEVARHRGEYRRSRDLHERSLDIRRDLGDRRGEASSLNNLGIVARYLGELDRAREYYERSLEIKRELGDRHREANSLTNLGNVFRLRGEYDRALECERRSLAISRELGYQHAEASSHINLGEALYRRGRYRRAREQFERALELAAGIEYRHGEVNSLAGLAAIDRSLGELDRARDRLRRALDLATEIGEPDDVTRIRYELGEVARVAGNPDRAGELYERALGDEEDVEEDDPEGDAFRIAKVRLARGRLALARGEPGRARELAARARGTFSEMGTTHWEGRSRLLLGRAAAEAGETGAAREHLRAALETFEDVDAPQDALRALEHLVRTCREAGDDERAERWCSRARGLLDDAPDPVADRHRRWVERCARRAGRERGVEG